MKAYFSTKQWNTIKTKYLKILIENNCQLRILYSVKTSFKNEGKIKTFSNKWKQFVTSKHTLKEILKGVLQSEKKMILEGKFKKKGKK